MPSQTLSKPFSFVHCFSLCSHSRFHRSTHVQNARINTFIVWIEQNECQTNVSRRAQRQTGVCCVHLFLVILAPTLNALQTHCISFSSKGCDLKLVKFSTTKLPAAILFLSIYCWANDILFVHFYFMCTFRLIFQRQSPLPLSLSNAKCIFT